MFYGAIHEDTIYSINKKEIPNELYHMNRKLNLYEYIIPNNGDIITKITAQDYYDKYRYLSIEEFEKYKGGICWDYVHYEHNDIQLEHKCFYAMFDDKKDYPTHTFIIYKYNNRYYWFESSWKSHIGIFVYKSEYDALSSIIFELYSYLQNTENIKNYYMSIYDPNSIPIGYTCQQFMDFQSKIVKKYFVNQIKYVKPIMSVNTDQLKNFKY